MQTSSPADQTKPLTDKGQDQPREAPRPTESDRSLSRTSDAEQDQPREAPEAQCPEILAPPQMPRPQGYAHGMAATGRLVVTAGHVGWDAQGRFAEGMAGQVEQALRNIAAVLHEAGAQPQHLVRLTWYVTSRSAYLAERKAIGAAYRRVIGRHYPAMAVVEVSALMESEALVEIEATAVVPEN